MLERIWQRATRSVLIWDLALTVLALWLAVQARGAIRLGYPLEPAALALPWPAYVAVLVVWASVFLLFFPQRALFEAPLLEALARLMAAVGVSVLLLAGLLYLSYRDISRLLFLYFAAFDLALLLAWHLVVRIVWRRRGADSRARRVLVVGAGRVGTQVTTELGQRASGQAVVAGYLDDDPHKRRDGVGGLPVFGRTGEIERVVAEQQIDEVIFALPPEEHALMTRLALKLEQHPVRVHMVPDVLDLAFTRTRVGELGGMPLISLREPMLSTSARRAKRLFDLTVSAALLALLSPVMALIALLITLDSRGPVIFRQVRVGENGRRFEMLKFRTMVDGADRQWQAVAVHDQSGSVWHKRADDPRITRMGRWLRRTSLDELPQLVNVVCGEMSLVGPRPEMPYMVDGYEPWQYRRFAVQPGITGWWQINGRSDRPMHLHTQDDLYYIQHYSIWLDVQILWRTVGVVLRGQGAY